MAGFNLDLSQGSSDHNGKLETFSVAAAHTTILAPGDVVNLTGTADADGIAGAGAASQGKAITGVIAGIEPVFAGENLTETGLPALVAGKIRCHVDPDLNFIVQCSAPLVANDVGLNADAAVTAATKSGGLTISNMKLDSSTKAVTATLQFRIMGLAPDPTTGLVTGNHARVRINNSTLRAGTAGV